MSRQDCRSPLPILHRRLEHFRFRPGTFLFDPIFLPFKQLSVKACTTSVPSIIKLNKLGNDTQSKWTIESQKIKIYN